MLPLVNRMTRAFGGWLAPAYGGTLVLRPDLDQVDALNPEREALWARLNAASFLTDDEKRAAAGYAAMPPSANPSNKYSPDQPRVPAGNSDGGQWTSDNASGGNGNDAIAGGDGNDKLGNPRARIGGNGPPPESGTLLGRLGAIAGRYVFGPLGALISMTEEMGNGELVSPYAGGKSEGVLESAEGDYYLKSGRKGPASKMPPGSSGFNAYTKTHVEGHAAALMHELGLTEARVYVNNPKICGSCTRFLDRMLPPGAKLEVVTPNGSQTFAGRIVQ